MWRGNGRPGSFGNRFREEASGMWFSGSGAPLNDTWITGDPQPGNLPYTADQLRALADRMDASRRNEVKTGTIASQGVPNAGRTSQKMHAASDTGPQRGTAPPSKDQGKSGNWRSGSRGASGPSPVAANAAAPRPDAKPMLSQDAYMKRQQLRWLLKKRLSQSRDALKAMQDKGAQRTPASRTSDPVPTPGMFLPTIKGDFEASFGTPLSYKEFGVEKLGHLLARECDDVLQEPSKVAQFMPMVKSQSTIPSAGETKAATRMAGRLKAPNLNQNTCMHVTRILRHYGYSPADITAYTKTLPQPQKPPKAAKAAKPATETAAAPGAAEADTEAATSPAPAIKDKVAPKPPAAASKQAPAGTSTARASTGSAPAKAGKASHSKSSAETPAGATPSAAGSAGHAAAPTARKRSSAAAMEAADAAETLAASDANVLGMASDDDDVLPVTAAAHAKPAEQGLAGGKRKAADAAAAASKKLQVVSEPKSTESTFWDDHADRELTEVEREFVVGLRARVYNRAFHAATFPPFVYLNPKAKNKNPKPAWLPAERGVGSQLQLTGLNPVPCPKSSTRQTIVSSVCPWVTDAARKASGQARACDVSSVLDHMLGELLTTENPGDEEPPEEYRELHATVQAAPELFLGLAAMPLALRKLPDGRLVAAVSGDVFTPTRCIAAKVLRQAAVVALLDTAPCMRHALGAGWAPSAAVEKRDASGARVMCLHVGEVSKRIEALLPSPLLSQLLALVCCENTKGLLASTHIADLVQCLPDDPEYACASFGPLLDLRLTLDRRLGCLTREASAAAVEGRVEAAAARPLYAVTSLLRDHAMMWGYHFQPVWVGMDNITQVVQVLMGDMVDAITSPRMFVRPSPATMLRHMMRVQLTDAAAAEAPVDVDVAADAGGAAGAMGAEAEGSPAKARRTVKEEPAEQAGAADVEMADAGAAGGGGAASAPGDASTENVPAAEEAEGAGEAAAAGPSETGAPRVKAEPVEAAAEGAAGEARMRGAGEEVEDAAAEAAEGEGAAEGGEGEGGAEAEAGSGGEKGGEKGGVAAAATEQGANGDVIMLGDTEDEADAAGEGVGAGGETAAEGESAAAADAGAAETGQVAVKQEAASTDLDRGAPDAPETGEAVAATNGGTADGPEATAGAAAAEGERSGEAAKEPEAVAGETGAAVGDDAAAEAADAPADRADAPAHAEVLVIDDEEEGAVEQTESGGSTAAAVAANADAAADSAEEEALLEEDWLMIHTSEEQLLRDYEACYGEAYPAGADMRAALRAVEWDFRVQREEEGGAVCVRDRACKRALRAPLAEAHRAAATKHLKGLFETANPQALLYNKRPLKAAAPRAAAAKGAGEVLGKRKEPEGGKAASQPKVAKGAAGIRGKSSAPVPVGRGVPVRQPLPARAGPGHASGPARGVAAVPPRRKSPMPRADLRPVPVHPRRQGPMRPVAPAADWIRPSIPLRHMRPAVAPLMQRQHSGMDSRSRDHWGGGRPSQRGNESLGGYIRSSGTAGGGGGGGGGHNGSYRGYQDLRRRAPSPVRGDYGRGDYRRSTDRAVVSDRRYAHDAGGGRMSDAPRHAVGRVEHISERHSSAHESAQPRYAADPGSGAALAAAGSGFLTVMPGSMYGARQVVHSTADGGPAPGSRYAPAAAAPHSIQQLQPVQSTTSMLLSAPAGAQTGAVYRLATVPGGGTVLIDAGPAHDSMPAVQQSFTQAYAQYSVDGFGRVQQAQASMQVEELPVRRGSGSQQYPMQEAPGGRVSRQYGQERY